MIADNQTNFVYLSGLLKTDKRFAVSCKRITEALDANQVSYAFLNNTKDIWARDYMPIQISDNKFIQYQYEPDYLQHEKYASIKTSPDKVLEELGIKTEKTDIILDGGNVIKSENTVIFTDKAIVENENSYTRFGLEKEIERLFEVDKIVWIPWDKENEYFGHADGMIRFIDNKTVLINQYFDEYDESFRTKFFGSLKSNGLAWEKLRFNDKSLDDRNWAYINFLQTRDLILLPSFGIEEDDQALSQIEEYFPEYSDGRVIKIKANNIVKHGGAFNCISWTIKK